MHRKLVVAATAAAVLGAPTMAHAATQNVWVGTPPSAQKALQKIGVDANQFFPTAMKVHVGDTVKFTPVGFHSANFPAAGKSPVAPFAPVGTVAGEKDAAGTPFWFNGLPQLSLDPSLTKPGYGKSFTMPSATGVQSGLPLAAKPKPMSVKFTKAGVYTYYCNIHPGMKGTVSVLAKTKKVPTAKAVGLAVNNQVKADKVIAATLAKATVPADTVLMGPEKKGMVLFAFLPGKLSVKPGTTVTFAMPLVATESHTAAFGPGDPNDDKTKSYLGDLSASIESPAIAGAAVYTSEAPGTTASYSPTLHGNGFWNSGVLDAVAASPPPSSAKVRFDTAGTYTYYCLIHPFMKAQVVVG